LDEFWGKKLLSLLHRCLAERDQALKLEALLTLRTALETASNAQSLQVACGEGGSGSGSGGMLGAVLAVVGDDWYRASAPGSSTPPPGAISGRRSSGSLPPCCPVRSPWTSTSRSRRPR
jgi:hypothetical protein